MKNLLQLEVPKEGKAYRFSALFSPMSPYLHDSYYSPIDQKWYVVKNGIGLVLRSALLSLLSFFAVVAIGTAIGAAIGTPRARIYAVLLSILPGGLLCAYFAEKMPLVWLSRGIGVTLSPCSAEEAKQIHDAYLDAEKTVAPNRQKPMRIALIYCAFLLLFGIVLVEWMFRTNMIQ